MTIKLPRITKKKEHMLFALVCISLIGISAIAGKVPPAVLSFLAYAFGALLVITAGYICMPSMR